MVLNLMKINFPKRKPCIITYHKYKNFLNEIFLTSLQDEVDKHGVFPYKNCLDAFSKIWKDMLEKHAPRKKIHLRANHKSFNNLEISKAIMTRT